MEVPNPLQTPIKLLRPKISSSSNPGNIDLTFLLKWSLGRSQWSLAGHEKLHGDSRCL